MEADLKLQQRIVQKANQPQSYYIADIEQAEKKLDFANRKIKQMEDNQKKLRIENEQLKAAKRGLSDDLQKLVAKRQDIESLQTTLMGILQHSSSKKIDIDDLKAKLAEGVRRDKYSQPFALSSAGADITLKKGAKKGGNHSSSDIMDNAQTLKMYDQEETAPAWYKTLKKNLH